MSAISIGQAVILGVVEGVTEFLPISSTGHLKITEGLMNIPVDDDAVVGFTAVIQVGAIAAVLVYFFKDILRFVGAWLRGLTATATSVTTTTTNSPGGSSTPPSRRHRRTGGQAAHRGSARLALGRGRHR